MKVEKGMGMVNAHLLADFILQKYGPMSHLKLQKLLYYTEAYHLASFGESLIPEDFEAWMHGPVCREVYNNLKDKSILFADLSFDGQGNPTEAITQKLTSGQLELIQDVLGEFSALTSLQLETATHNEFPWKEARWGYDISDKCTVKIKKSTMLEFYRKEFYGEMATEKA